MSARGRHGAPGAAMMLGLCAFSCGLLLAACSAYDAKLVGTAGGVRRDAGPPKPPAATDAGSDAALPDAGPSAGSGGAAGGGMAGSAVAGSGMAGSGMAGSGGCDAGGAGACDDGCPLDPDKTEPGACGCGMSEADGDGDGAPDCVDGCPSNPDKQQPGTCGCAMSEVDGDGDGTPDCVDSCPADEAKTSAGECGCGVAESPTDSDGDDTPDCIDECDDDPGKTAAGICGCGVAETDSDLDETPDCMDDCDSDPDKTAPGVCGCGIADDDVGTTVGCVALKNALVRRYRFEGTGTSATDSQGGAAGTVVGGTMSGGAVSLSGNNQYVDLPNAVISGLTDATIEAWVTWGGGSGWQRIFDFGTSGTEGAQGTGRSYLFLTPSAGSTNFLRVAYSTNGSTNETAVGSPTRALPMNVLCHVAVVVDDTHDTLSLYLNTTLEGSVTFTGHLADISDVNNWLGRSQFSQDPELAGSISEFRIYNKALTPSQLNFSLTQGTDPAYLQ